MRYKRVGEHAEQDKVMENVKRVYRSGVSPSIDNLRDKNTAYHSTSELLPKLPTLARHLYSLDVRRCHRKSRDMLLSRTMLDMANLRLDRQYERVVSIVVPGDPPVPKGLLDLRAINNPDMSWKWAQLPTDPTVTETVLNFTSKDGNTINLHRFMPPDAAERPSPGPANIYCSVAARSRAA